MEFDFANSSATDYARYLNSQRQDSPMKIVEDTAHWASVDIHTADDLRRCFAKEGYSDFYKELNGFRPRRDWTGYTTEEIEAAYEALFDDAYEDDATEEIVFEHDGHLKHNPFAVIQAPPAWKDY